MKRNVDELLKKRVELRRQLREVDEELRILNRKPARQVSCGDFLAKISTIDGPFPIVAYEGRIPKKITKVIVSKNHVRVEISSNLQHEYND